MKMTYTISEYIENPMSITDLSALQGKERAINVITYLCALLAAMIPLYFAPGELKFVAIFSGGLGYLISLFIVGQIEKYKGLNFTDSFVVTSGYTKKVDLFEHQNTLNILEVSNLKDKLKIIGRSAIQLERDIIQHIYISEPSRKESDYRH
jgi:hypothetical protein